MNNSHFTELYSTMLFSFSFCLCIKSQLFLFGGCIYPHSMFAWLILSIRFPLCHAMSSRNIWLSWRSANPCLFRPVHCWYRFICKTFFSIVKFYTIILLPKLFQVTIVQLAAYPRQQKLAQLGKYFYK